MSFEQLFNIIAPHECLGCHAEGALLCGVCRTRLPEVAAPHLAGLERVWAVTTYDGVAKRLVYKLKFERAAAAANDLAAAMAAKLPKEDWVITHLPTAPGRVRQRGYDQAQLIARKLALLTGAPYTALLVRQSGQRQLGQSRAVRQVQLHDAFRPLRALAGQHVLLVDDVLTTGASCQAAAAVLRAAGAAQVSAAVFALTPWENDDFKL